MHALVELRLVDVGGRQLRQLEQRGLQPLRALALEHLLLQAGIGRSQFARAQLHAGFEFVLAFLAFQRSQHVVGDELQQRTIFRRVDVAPRAIALHHQCAMHLAVAQHRHPQPVSAWRTKGDQRAIGLRQQLRVIAHQWPAAGQHVPGGGIANVLQQRLRAVVLGVVVRLVDVVDEAQGAALDVAAHDEEVFRIHQRADDAVQALQHLRHVQRGAGQVGDGEQRALQMLGALQLPVRIVQVQQLDGVVQPAHGQGHVRPERGQQRAAVGTLGQVQQQGDAFVVQQAHGHHEAALGKAVGGAQRAGEQIHRLGIGCFVGGAVVATTAGTGPAHRGMRAGAGRFHQLDHQRTHLRRRRGVDQVGEPLDLRGIVGHRHGEVEGWVHIGRAVYRCRRGGVGAATRRGLGETNEEVMQGIGQRPANLSTAAAPRRIECQVLSRCCHA